jgi:hypothetical protein
VISQKVEDTARVKRLDVPADAEALTTVRRQHHGQFVARLLRGFPRALERHGPEGQPARKIWRQDSDLVDLHVALHCVPAVRCGVPGRARVRVTTVLPILNQMTDDLRKQFVRFPTCSLLLHASAFTEERLTSQNRNARAQAET